MKNIFNRIKEYKIISFDIFDTAIIRKYESPLDVFHHLEELSMRLGFAERRIRAERMAREIHAKDQKGEITFSQIYELLPPEDSYIKEMELELELAACESNPEILSLYEYCCREGKKIWFVSDMYLPREHIEKMLFKCGYGHFDNIHISSDNFKTKWSGEAFDYILNEFNSDSELICHIGDNRHSDYVMAGKNGIRGILVSSPHEQMKKNKFLSSKIFSNSCADNNYARVVRGLILNSSLKYNKENYWFNFGYQYGGPILYAFSKWLLNEAADQGIERLYLLSRDGYIIEKLLNIIGTEMDFSYLYCSRRALILSSLHYPISDRDIEEFSQFQKGMKMSGYIERLQLPFDKENELKQEMKKYGFSLESVKGGERIRKFFKRIQKFLYEEGLRERKNLIKYFQEKGLLSRDGSKKAIVDVGWMGSMQRRLDMMIHEEKFDPIRGYYFGIAKCSSNYSSNMKGYVLNYGQPGHIQSCLFRGIEIIELLFSALHPGIIRINEDLTPCYSKESEEENFRMTVTDDIQRGIISFTKDIHSFLDNFPVKITPEMAVFSTLPSLLENPTKTDLKYLSGIRHSQAFGDGYYRSLLPYYFNLREFFSGRRKQVIALFTDSFWLPRRIKKQWRYKWRKVLCNLYAAFKKSSSR